MNTPTALPLADRVELGLSMLARTFVERDGFLSDSDVLDAADAFTTSKFGDLTWPDRDELSNQLDARVGNYLVAIGIAVYDQTADPTV